jgi:hypothetical protein
MMQAATVSYSNAQGLIADYVVDDKIQFDAFIQAWAENNTLKKLLSITEQHMNITDLKQHQGLKQALLAAYHLGKKDAQSK